MILFFIFYFTERVFLFVYIFIKYVDDKLREGYKVRKQKNVWKFPNLGLTPPNTGLEIHNLFF